MIMDRCTECDLPVNEHGIFTETGKKICLRCFARKKRASWAHKWLPIILGGLSLFISLLFWIFDGFYKVIIVLFPERMLFQTVLTNLIFIFAIFAFIIGNILARSMAIISIFVIVAWLILIMCYFSHH